MKRFSILTLVLVTALLDACGAKATPTPALSAVDIQNTSVAVASTMIAGTQAAIPTATPQPTETPTLTPLPTNTFVPLSSLTAAATQNSSSGNGDTCINALLPNALEGNKVKIRINNSTKAAVNVSVYLNRTIPPAVCGYRAYTLEPGGGLVISDMVEGCFTIWAWNPDPKGYFMVTNGAASCIGASYPVAFDISNKDIRQR